MDIESWIDLVLFVGFFAALLISAWWWDHSWPDTTEMMLRRGKPIKEEDIPE